MEKVFVTKSFLPPKEEYLKYIEKIYETCQLTNDGPLQKELAKVLGEYFGCSNVNLVSNGTIALQIAINSLGLGNCEIITTPFSYIATTSSIMWQKCKPVFIDIEQDNYTLDADKIENAITDKTKAIMPVHVFGYACQIEKIQKIADKYNLKVIYDAAHAFGSKYKNKQLSTYGDISTLSFHATKLFHTIEGGAIIAKDKALFERTILEKAFGHCGDNHITLGINAKLSEAHAAMGLANLPYIDKIIKCRRDISDKYDSLLSGIAQRPKKQTDLEYNYAYYPILLKNEEELIKVQNALNNENIFPRRYFYPSINTIKYVNGEKCPISENIASRILCLPLYVGMEESLTDKICKIIKNTIN